MIPFLLVIVVIVVVGASVLAYRNRPEHSIESGIHSFKREMRALAPPSRRRRPPETGEDDTPELPGTGPRDHG